MKTGMVATRITSKRPQSAKSIRRRNSKDIKIILKRKEELNADIDNCIFANADQRQKKKPKLQIRNRCKPNANENFDKTINQNSQVNIHMSNTLETLANERNKVRKIFKDQIQYFDEIINENEKMSNQQKQSPFKLENFY